MAFLFCAFLNKKEFPRAAAQTRGGVEFLRLISRHHEGNVTIRRYDRRSTFGLQVKCNLLSGVLADIQRVSPAIFLAKKYGHSGISIIVYHADFYVDTCSLLICGLGFQHKVVGHFGRNNKRGRSNSSLSFFFRAVGLVLILSEPDSSVRNDSRAGLNIIGALIFHLNGKIMSFNFNADRLAKQTSVAANFCFNYDDTLIRNTSQVNLIVSSRRRDIQTITLIIRGDSAIVIIKTETFGLSFDVSDGISHRFVSSVKYADLATIEDDDSRSSVYLATTVFDTPDNSDQKHDGHDGKNNDENRRQVPFEKSQKFPHIFNLTFFSQTHLQGNAKIAYYVHRLSQPLDSTQYNYIKKMELCKVFLKNTGLFYQKHNK